MAKIKMTGAELAGLLQPAVDLIGSDYAARVYIEEVARKGLLVRAIYQGKSYTGAFPSDTIDNGIVRSSWYAADWIADVLAEIARFEQTECSIEVRATGLRILVRSGSEPVFQCNVASHMVTIYFCPKVILTGDTPKGR